MLYISVKVSDLICIIVIAAIPLIYLPIKCLNRLHLHHRATTTTTYSKSLFSIHIKSEKKIINNDDCGLRTSRFEVNGEKMCVAKHFIRLIFAIQYIILHIHFNLVVHHVLIRTRMYIVYCGIFASW